MVNLERTPYCQLQRLVTAPITGGYDEYGMKVLLINGLVARTKVSNRPTYSKYEYRITDEGRQHLVDQPTAPPLKLSDTGIHLIMHILGLPDELMTSRRNSDMPGNSATLDRLIVDGGVDEISNPEHPLDMAWRVSAAGQEAFKHTGLGQRFLADRAKAKRHESLSNDFVLAYQGDTSDAPYLQAKAIFVMQCGDVEFAAEIQHEADAALARIQILRDYFEEHWLPPVEIKLYPNNTLCGMRFEYGIQVGIQEGIWHIQKMPGLVTTQGTPQEKTDAARNIAAALLSATWVVDKLNEPPQAA